jgi:hypothetical protein
MATTTPNFGWPVPTSTDLVKNGATAIEALGDAIDASLVDLEGGTTGQVLAKASNADMDFAWVAQDDSNAIQNTQLTAKGALITAFSSATPATLTVGANGETLVADSSTSTGLRYQGNYAAGKNKIINGDFGIWQRGTSFTSAGYTSDRWTFNVDPTATVSRQTFTPGTAPVAGYEGQYFLRAAKAVGGSFIIVQQLIEDVRTFAGQTVTVSYWMKADATVTNSLNLLQAFGSGGSASVEVPLTSHTVTTSWTRYSQTVTIPSVSGKTIGDGSSLAFRVIRAVTASATTIDVWGVQVEASNTATAFQTATGTIQGELAACQRYYQRLSASTATGAMAFGLGWAFSANGADLVYKYPVEMRVTPTVLDFSALGDFQWQGTSSSSTPSSITYDNNINSRYNAGVTFSKTSGYVAGGNYVFLANSTTNAFLGFGAEL